jgi:hypothetical protein
MTTRWWVSQYGLRITGERDAWRDPGYRLCAGSRGGARSPLVISAVTIVQEPQRAAVRIEGMGIVNVHPGATPEPQRLGVGLSAHSITGYEVTFRCTSDGSQYVAIVRWNGALGDFTYIANLTPGGPGIHNGDTVKATVIGNTITAYINSTQVLQGTDATYTSGSPGIGFDVESSNGSAVDGNVRFNWNSSGTTTVKWPSQPRDHARAGQHRRDHAVQGLASSIYCLTNQVLEKPIALPF